MTGIKALLNQREQIKSRVTRLLNFFNSVSQNAPFSESDLTTLKKRLLDNADLLQEYNDIHLKITCQSTDGSHEDEIESFENLYYKTINDIELFLSKNLPQPSVSNSSSTTGSDNTGAYPAVRLPSVSVPQFQGSYQNWPEFYDAFNSLINENANLSNIQKFYYLISAVKGEASSAISSIKVCDENYVIAWDVLKKRFENKKLIVQNNLKALFNLEPVKRDTHANIQKFLDDVKKTIQTLQNYGQPTIDTLLIYIISAKFTLNTRREWELFNSKDEFPTYQELIEFLEKRSHLLGSLEINQGNSVMFNNNNSKNANFKVNVAIDQNKQNKCVFCDNKEHQIYKCESFLKLDSSARINACKRLHLCINCLRKGHTSRECRSFPCRKCRRYHNVLLHIENAVKSDQNEIKNDAPVDNNSSTQINPESSATASTSTSTLVSPQVYANMPHETLNRQILLSTACNNTRCEQ